MTRRSVWARFAMVVLTVGIMAGCAGQTVIVQGPAIEETIPQFIVPEEGAVNLSEFLKPCWESVDTIIEETNHSQWYFIACKSAGADEVKYAVVVLLPGLPWPWFYIYLQDDKLNLFESGASTPEYARVALGVDSYNFLAEAFFTYFGVTVAPVHGS